MNKGAQEENTRKLLEYQLVAQQQTDREDKKLTIMLSFQYHDALERLAILQGKTKTAVVRQALDELAAQFGDELLYPQVELTLL